jgi:hypothetical protein
MPRCRIRTGTAQTYSVTLGKRTARTRRAARQHSNPTGQHRPALAPNYDGRGIAITTLPGGIKVFAGQRDDPFFVDLGSIFDSRTAAVQPAAHPPARRMRDTTAGEVRTHAIALQIEIATRWQWQRHHRHLRERQLAQADYTHGCNSGRLSPSSGFATGRTADQRSRDSAWPRKTNGIAADPKTISNLSVNIST